jgi:5,10-methylenetetrahydromethanopterin reductase
MADGGLRLSGQGAARGGDTLTTESVLEVAEGARAADAAGFDFMGYGDTVWRDCYVTLGAMAQTTERVGLGPSVTNPVSRSPMATAMAIASVDEVSGGRAWLGIGLGQSATTQQLRDGLNVIFSSFRLAKDHEPWPDGIEVDESVNAIQWVTRRVPILVASGGPKGQRIAAEVADGVMLRAGDVDPKELPALIQQLHSWRADGPRAGDPFEVQFLLPAFITDDIEEGRRAMGPVVSARANTSTRERDLGGDMLEAFRAYRDRYDYTHHASSVNLVNQDLMAEVGLADYFYDRYSFVGDEKAMLEKLEQLESVGITATGIPGPVDAGLRVLAAYRERHPKDGSTSPLRPVA